MTPNEERHLYVNDYAAWCKYAAPRWLDLMLAAIQQSAQAMWKSASLGLRSTIASTAISRAEALDQSGKAELWGKLIPELQKEIRRVKERK